MHWYWAGSLSKAHHVHLCWWWYKSSLPVLLFWGLQNMWPSHICHIRRPCLAIGTQRIPLCSLRVQNGAAPLLNHIVASRTVCAYLRLPTSAADKREAIKRPTCGSCRHCCCVSGHIRWWRPLTSWRALQVAAKCAWCAKYLHGYWNACRQRWQAEQK